MYPIANSELYVGKFDLFNLSYELLFDIGSQSTE